jgi:putative membrane protein
MRNQTQKTLLTLLAAATFLTGAAFAKSSLMADDQKFLREAAQGGMAEVALGHLAVEKASSAEVKAFGQQMIDDHSKANENLKTLAASKSFALPEAVSPDQKKTHDQLAGLSGAAFDRQYMKLMAEDHKKVAASFQTESIDAKDVEVKNFATSTLPTIKEHLKMAQALAAKTGK